MNLIKKTLALSMTVSPILFLAFFICNMPKEERDKLILGFIGLLIFAVLWCTSFDYLTKDKHD